MRNDPTLAARLIREARVKGGKTLRELAEVLGVKAQFICNIERGAADIPVKHFRKAAAYLGISSKEARAVYIESWADRARREFDGN